MDTMTVAQRLINGVFGLAIGGLGLVLLVMAMQRPAPKWVVDFTAQEMVWVGFGAAITGLAFVWLATTKSQRFDDRIPLCQQCVRQLPFKFNLEVGKVKMHA